MEFGREKTRPGDVFVVNGQPFAQCKTFVPARCSKRLDMRPSRLWIDIIASDRRNASPIVDPGAQETPVVVWIEVWRGLNVHFASQHQASDRDGSGDIQGI